MLRPRVGAVLVLAAALWAGAWGAMPARRSYDTHHYYVAELDAHAPCATSPHDVAAALGAEYVEPVGELPHHYLLRAEKSTAQARRSVTDEVDPAADPVLAAYRAWQAHARRDTALCPRRAVRSLERQQVRWRHKRHVIYDPATMRDEFPELRAPVPVTARWMGDERAPVPAVNVTRQLAERFDIHDPLFYQQWHMANNEQIGFDLRLEGAWKAASGRGVTVSLIDDGIDSTHPDLAAAFNAAASYDFNDHTALPEPRMLDDQHGTRCAGEIAAAKNDVCGVGVAPGAQVAGVRILSAPISDADEAAALNYAYQTSGIYSCSWGPSDNGQSMDAPKGLVAKAMLNGIYNGRGGRGSLFVFAGGNGGAADDQCNFDGYTNSIYTITIAAVDREGHRPYYSEMCSAIIASSYSSGKGAMIHTSNVRKFRNQTCASSHGGTSAAAPLVAGMLALALEVRPELTWRDAQHLIIQSSYVTSPRDPDWQTTAAGLQYSHKFGFGVVDATKLVELARTHELVPPQAWLTTPKHTVDAPLAQGAHRNASLRITREMVAAANLASLEHVTVTVWIEHKRRGHVQVVLYGPHGTKSVLASPRRYDSATDGFPGWTFMTLKHWNEDPVGEWALEVSDHSSPSSDEPSDEPRGQFVAWSLTLWGAAQNASLARPWNFDEASEEYSLELPGAPSTTILGTVPPATPSGAAAPTTSRLLVKPTHALPDDHHNDPGETSQVFGQAAATQPADTASLAGLAHASPVWLLVAAGVGAAVAAALVAVFVLRARRASRGAYAPIGDDVALGVVGADGADARPAGDLYSAFALDDEDDVDDEPRSAHSSPPARDSKEHHHETRRALLDGAPES